MQPFLAVLRRHSLLIGIPLMYLFTWPLMLASAGYVQLHIPDFVFIFAGWGLIVASVLMTALTLGRSGVAALLKRFLIWRVGWKWYLVALLLYPAIMLASVLLNAALTRTPLDFSTVMAHKIFGASAQLPLYILPFFIVDLISNGEETAWRGYVLPRLQARYGALASSLILGLIWGLWHLPLFLARSTQTIFPWFMLRVTLDSVLFAWLFNNTRGSLLLVTLLHASANTAGVFLPIANTATAANLGTLLFQIATSLVVVVIVVLTAGRASLSRTQPKQVTASPVLAPALGDPAP